MRLHVQSGAPDRPAIRVDGRIPGLDGLRGIAIAAVVVFHASGFVQRTPSALDRAVTVLTSSGALGVDLFFVLSGFLITGILVDAKGAPGYFRSFYARRVLRIFPLYYAYVAFWIWVLPWLWSSPEVAAAVRQQGWLWAYATNIFRGFAARARSASRRATSGRSRSRSSSTSSGL